MFIFVFYFYSIDGVIRIFSKRGGETGNETLQAEFDADASLFLLISSWKLLIKCYFGVCCWWFSGLQ